MSGHHLHTGGHVTEVRTLAQRVEAVAERLDMLRSTRPGRTTNRHLTTKLTRAHTQDISCRESGSYHGLTFSIWTKDLDPKFTALWGTACRDRLDQNTSVLDVDAYPAGHQGAANAST